ncbi:MAG TPA: hypothetical protein VFI27_02645 [candidate division Zixibacteria bacterium]|nr:hypothetical protein [candidate division Zixibacteria bacterium]
MSPVKQLTAEDLMRENIFHESMIEQRLWLESTETVEVQSSQTEIVDLLGCFCEQTGAFFG